MSQKNKAYVNYLLNKASSDDDAEALAAFKKLYNTPGLTELIDSNSMATLGNVLNKKRERTATNGISGFNPGNIQQDADRNNSTTASRHPSTSYRPNVKDHRAGHSSSHHTHSDKLKKVPNRHEHPLVNGDQESTNGKNVSPFFHLNSLFGSDKKNGTSSQSHSALRDGFPPIPSDTTKQSVDSHYKFPSYSSSVPVQNNSEARRKSANRTNVLKENHSLTSHCPSKDVRVNGYLDKSHSSSSQSFSAHRESHSSHSNHPVSSESSHHSHSKRVSHGPDPGKPLAYHKKVPSPVRHSQPTVTTEHISPEKRKPTSYSKSPNGKHQDPSQKPHSANRSNRPVLSSGSSDFSNEDRPDESKNLTIDISDSACVSSSEKNNASSPYCMQLKPGMFNVRKVGPDNQVIHVRELKGIGSTPHILDGGGYSWGWYIEKKVVNSDSSSTREKNSSDHQKSRSSSSDQSRCRSSKDTQSRDPKCKRKINYDKNDPCAPPPKKLLSSREEVKHKPEAKEEKPIEVKREKCKNNIHEKEVKRTSAIDRPKPDPPLVKKFTPNIVPSSDGTSRVSIGDSEAKSSNVIDNSTMDFLASKKDRRAVYSGKKSSHEVSSLKNICLESLKKNILNIRIPQVIPFELVKPVLESLSSSQLHKVEDQNKHIIPNTDTCWQIRVNKNFRSAAPRGNETWRDVFVRETRKQDQKLNNVTARISNGMAKAPAERQAKYVGVDYQNPEIRQKKPKVEERSSPPKPPAPEQNGVGNYSGKSSGSESSCSPKIVPKPLKLPKAAKKPVPALMLKAKKMVSYIRR